MSATAASTVERTHCLGRGLRVVLMAVLAVSLLAHVLVTLQPVFADEFPILGNFWDFAQRHTVIPDHTAYPALYSYLTAPFTGAFAALLVAGGTPPSAHDLSEWFAYRPELGLWPARVVSLLTWCLCVWAVYRITRELPAGRDLALLSAAAFASALGTLRYSGYGLPDITMMMWVALATLHALRLARGDRPQRSALLAGLLAGLAMATKYTAVALVVPLVVAALISPERRHLRSLGWLAGMALVGFVAGCPGWVLAPAHYWQGLMAERTHMALGHLGFGGVPLLGQLELLVTADPVLLAFAIVGGIGCTWAARRQRSGLAVLVALTAAVLLMAAPARKQSLQYLFALYPALGIIAACGLTARDGVVRRAWATVLAAGLLASAGCGLWWGCRVALLPDSNRVAREWMDARLPDDAVIALDWTDVPRLVTERDLSGLRAGLRTDFMRNIYAGLRGFPSVPIDYTDSFLRETEAGYIITSSTCYARFFEFGHFTRIRPSEDSPLRPVFDTRRSFYEALMSGAYGWRLEHEVSTGNGPRVLIFRRAT